MPVNNVDVNGVRGVIRYILCEQCRGCKFIDMYKIEDIIPNTTMMKLILEREQSDCVIGIELLDSQNKPDKFVFGSCHSESKDCLISNLRRIVNIAWLDSFARQQREIMEKQSLANRALSMHRPAPMGRKAHKRFLAKEKARLQAQQKKIDSKPVSDLAGAMPVGSSVADDPASTT